ncbi:MAG: alpha/beta fold hydrolase, partial [Hyphomicrobiaceae bacterium]
KVRSLSLIEPTLFHLLDSAGHADALAEIRSVADRVVEFVDNNNPDEAARGFITYWVGPGAFDRMDERVRTAVVAGMAKLRAEWLVAFDGVGVESNAFRQLDVPIQLIRATQTTLAARDVVDVLRNLWPSARFFEVAGAGHMAPLTHPTEINGLLADFLHQVRV